jgi:hypothetical protein
MFSSARSRRLLNADTTPHTAILIHSPIAARFQRVSKNPVISDPMRFSLPTVGHDGRFLREESTDPTETSPWD